MPEPSTAVSILKSLAGIPEPIVKSAVGFVESLLGEPLKVAGSALADQVEMWKWRNRVRVAARAKEIMEDEKVAARVVPPSFLLPVIEGAGYTDDATLREMWARLLVSGVKHDDAQCPAYVHILRAMGAADACALKEVDESLSAGLDRTRLATLIREVGLLQSLGVVEVSGMPYLHDGSLSSLELARQVRGHTGVKHVVPRATVTLSITGAGFMDAVEGRDPGDRWNDRAVHRTTNLLCAIRDCLPASGPGPTTDRVALLVGGATMSTVSKDEIRDLLRFFADEMGWSDKPGPGWIRTKPTAE